MQVIDGQNNPKVGTINISDITSALSSLSDSASKVITSLKGGNNQPVQQYSGSGINPSPLYQQPAKAGISPILLVGLAGAAVYFLTRNKGGKKK